MDGKAGSTVAKVNVIGWFSHEELRPCPLCSEHAALGDDQGHLLLCLDCGEPLDSSTQAPEV
jgi:hypothetical protein